MDAICLKQYLSEKDYEEIKELEKRCHEYDQVNTKLELEYKINVSKDVNNGLDEINEFFYHIDDKLVAYLGTLLLCEHRMVK